MINIAMFMIFKRKINMVNFFDSSDDMKNLGARKNRTTKYPWDDLEVGQSFDVRKGTKFTSIRVQCYNKSKELGKIFRALEHSNGSIEVGRLE